MKDIDRRNVEDFLKEGNAKQLLEFLIQSNKNLMPEEAKILMESLSKFEAPLSQMYVKIVDQEDRKLQRIYETRNKIIDVLVILAQSNYENANRIIEILKQELDHLKEEEKEVREDSKMKRIERFLFGIRLLGVLLLSYVRQYLVVATKTIQVKELGCKITILCYMNGIGLLFV